jgi:peptidoglycan/LPS O-acetylase OafA/YrhL
MVAVLAVFANHLWGWPRGGFVGIDVFLVITGFLITGSLLRASENTDSVSIRKFYGNRVRRIVPMTAVVLILTAVAAILVFPPSRADKVGTDALLAASFMANWRFALDGAHPLASVETASPVLHFWPLSIQEQFYLVWPLLILAIGVVVAAKGRHQARRTLPAAGVIGVIVVASFGWAVYGTATSPNWAYFDTFARLWELGVGALLATAASVLARIPMIVKPCISWTGLLLIGASMFLVRDTSDGYPAPWALLTVIGTALVIAAGVEGEPNFQPLLRNRVSTYVGNISFALYLVHWPVIVILSGLMATSLYFYLCVLAVSFGLAVALHHFVENPLRDADRERIRDARRAMAEGVYVVERSSKIAAVAAVALVTVGVCAYAARPEAFEPSAPTETVRGVPATP